jgi:hypothetical protein
MSERAGFVTKHTTLDFLGTSLRNMTLHLEGFCYVTLNSILGGTVT